MTPAESGVMATTTTDFGLLNATPRQNQSRLGAHHYVDWDAVIPPLELSTSLICAKSDTMHPTVPRIPSELSPRISRLVVSSAANGYFGDEPYHYLSAQNISGFLALLELSTTTVFYNIRRLEIFAWGTEERVHLPILQMLPQFRRLCSLILWCPFPYGLPDLPWLTELELSGTFGSYASFFHFMSNLPALQSLVLDDVQWADIPQHPLSFPSLDLRTLSLDFGMRAPIVTIMLHIRTRSLTLGLWSHGSFPIVWLQRVPTYLHRLGGHLCHLNLRCDSDEHIQHVSAMDFRHNVGLQQLEIGEAVRLSVVGESSEVDVSPFLERLLARIAPHCRLQTPHSWSPDG
ncbi:hypothetical protein B0H14DRAFT_3592730 [Mycena olivaceomarginata]|nr:hypothetical protein B0H14DRAFT_3592730 [Mycena olivaceomarginata]